MTIDEIRAMVETARALERRGNEIARSGYNAALACDMLNDADLIRSVIRAGLAVGEPPTPQYLLDEYEDGRSKGYAEGFERGYAEAESYRRECDLRAEQERYKEQ